MTDYILTQQQHDDMTGEIGVPFGQYLCDEWVLLDGNINQLTMSGVDLDAAAQTLYSQDFDTWKGTLPNQSTLRIITLAKNEAKSKHFHNVNYKTELSQSLHAKRSFTFGVLDKVEWYDDADLTNKVIQVDIDYNHDVTTGMALDRATTRTWYKEDGSAHPSTKVTTKDYTINPANQIVEMKTRRENNVNQTNINLIGSVPTLSALDPQPVSGTMDQSDVIVSGQTFFGLYENQKNVYVDTGSAALEDAVRDETDTQFDWFDCDASPLGITGVTDVRDFIIWNLSAGARTS